MLANSVLYGDCVERLAELPDECAQTCVTSPPYYGLRVYLAAEHPLKGREVGLEPTPDAYVRKLVAVFRGVRRVLRRDGTLWIVVGDSYNAAGRKGHGTRDGYKQGTNRAAATGADRVRPHAPDLKPKDLIGVPWRLALALQKDGWYLRAENIWLKPNAMPDSVADRTTRAHEHVFMLTKSESYFYDAEAIRETVDAGGSRNRRSVWSINTRAYAGAHFAVMPIELATICVRAGSRAEDLVLDPFAGSGTTLAVAKKLGRRFIGVELNDEYRPIIEERTRER